MTLKPFSQSNAMRERRHARRRTRHMINIVCSWKRAAGKMAFDKATAESRSLPGTTLSSPVRWH